MGRLSGIYATNKTMILASAIKDRLEITRVFDYYGIAIGRNGFALCPFHNEKTPSLKVYHEQNSFYCHACNSGGSVIDFVMQLFAIPFTAACVRLNADFNLGLSAQRPSRQEENARVAELRAAKAAAEARERETTRLCNEHRRLWAAKRDKCPAGLGDEIDPEYIEACKYLDYIAYRLDVYAEEGRGQRSSNNSPSQKTISSQQPLTN